MQLRLIALTRAVSAPLLVLTALTACSSGDSKSQDSLTPAEPCRPDESAAVPTRPEPGTWQRIEIPGAKCSDESSYAIFVNYSSTSNNLVVALEPGGACWDYESCSPNGGLRGAANPKGLPDGIEHMGRYQFLPLLRPDEKSNPIHDWNKVFIPYCTGDIHTGNNVIEYEGPNGEKTKFHHNGHNNIMASIQWLNQAFTNVPRLMVTGCSAGGAGAIINYHFFRKGITGAQCGYLLDDSGPIFPSSGNSGPLHEKVRASWNLDPIIDSLAGDLQGITPDDLKRDFGLINSQLADIYRQDRLALTVYRRDLNYSLYSYETFFKFPPYTRIHELWDEDIAALREVYDSRPNLGYFMPYFRIDNCSHCVSIPPIGLNGSDLAKAVSTPWLGAEIQESSVTLRDYVLHLLRDEEPLEKYFEEAETDGAFTPDEAGQCSAL